MSVTKMFERLRMEIDSIPVIDCHEHTTGPANAPKYEDPIQALAQGYVASDLMSSSDNIFDVEPLNNPERPLEERWPIFEQIWKRTEHTGYARVSKWVLKEIYGETELNLDALHRIKDKLVDLRDETRYYRILDDAGIKIRLVNIWTDVKTILDGSHTMPECDRYFIGLPEYHAIRRYGDVDDLIRKPLGKKPVTLDEYIDCCRELFDRLKAWGAIGFKDQSAYSRTLQYDNATHAEAEALFNRFMADPRQSLGWPEAKPLDDYLFHRFMQIARDMDMPVQMHTGHMAGIYNDIEKTNAVHLTSVLELHKDVRFDLFHGNWPYSGEWLYLGKNYQNVALNCCWLHIIDPVYARNILHQSLTAVPHGKIHGFGGDYGDTIEYAAGHLAIARDNIALALANHIDTGWLGYDEAKQVAADWLYNNPNRFFRLGLDPVTV